MRTADEISDAIIAALSDTMVINPGAALQALAWTVAALICLRDQDKHADVERFSEELRELVDDEDDEQELDERDAGSGRPN